MSDALTKAQERVIRDSFAELRDVAGALANLFYGRLFAVAPELRPMFKGDIREQGLKLMAMLDSCVDSVGRLEEIRPQLRELGRRHVEYGTKSEHYPVVAKALLWSLAQALEHRFDRETKEAWTQLILGIAGEMEAGAANKGT